MQQRLSFFIWWVGIIFLKGSIFGHFPLLAKWEMGKAITIKNDDTCLTFCVDHTYPSFFTSPIFLMAFRHFALQKFEFRFKYKKANKSYQGNKRKKGAKIDKFFSNFLSRDGSDNATTSAASA